MILDNQRRRSFAQADINTIIALFSPPDEKSTLGLGRKARFVMFRVPFEEVPSPIIFQEIDEAQQLTTDPKYRQLQVPVFGTNETIALTELSRPEFRIRVLEQADLYKDGVGSTDDETNFILAEPIYSGTKWGGRYLRAPKIFWTILEKGKGKLVRLGDIAEVRRGFTTGANDFFYLEATGGGAPKGLIHVRNAAGWEGLLDEDFLEPAVKSPKELSNITVDVSTLKYKMLMCHLSKAELRKQGKPNTLEYIKWGESQRYNKRPTCSSRERWWDLGIREAARVNCSYLIDDQIHFYFTDDGFFVSDNFQELYSADKIVASVASVPFTQMLCELGGRNPFGGGLLKVQTYEVADLLVLDPSTLPSSKLENLRQDFDTSDLDNSLRNVRLDIKRRGISAKKEKQKQITGKEE